MMKLRAAYLVLGAMIGTIVTTLILHRKIDNLMTLIPSIAGTSGWYGCAYGRDYPGAQCKEVGRMISKIYE